VRQVKEIELIGTPMLKHPAEDWPEMKIEKINPSLNRQAIERMMRDSDILLEPTDLAYLESIIDKLEMRSKFEDCTHINSYALRNRNYLILIYFDKLSKHWYAAYDDFVGNDYNVHNAHEYKEWSGI
jgi:hypothetical protein